MDATTAAGGGSALLVLLGLVGWVVRWKLTRDAAREDREVEARIKRDDELARNRDQREERVVTAAEAQAHATAEQAVAMTKMAEAMRDVGSKVEKLEGVVQGMREDLDELTPVETPSGKERQAARLVVVDGEEPPKHQPPPGGRHSSHKER